MVLSDICNYITERIPIKEVAPIDYISTENMIVDKGGVNMASTFPENGSATHYQEGDILISNIRPYFKKIWQADREGACSTDVLCIRAKENVDKNYLYYLLSQQDFFDYVMSGAKGSKMPRGDKKHIMEWSIILPTLNIQKKIADLLSSLDDKIEINRRINANLEEQASALFDYYFDPSNGFMKGATIASLTDVSEYLNGLAMQKFPALNGEEALPVLKIKELGQGKCDENSDFCSNKIDEKYIVNDGDIIFSWSGTLLVDIWCGGTCGLNQHLFKVTPKEFPKWFVYFWTRRHLDKFIRIAKDKAVTMGHIRRGDLESSDVLIPSDSIMSIINDVISPILKKIIALRIENRNLAEIRDTLLPKLMSGEIKL